MPTSKGKTLYVGGTGEGNYTMIQDAIDNASDDDTIFVYDEGSPYYENVKIDKSITLIGEDRNTTVIDGGGSRNVILINVDRVTIFGFTLRNGEWGICIWFSNCNILSSNKIYENVYSGIHAKKSSYNKIINNSIYLNTRGIWFEFGEEAEYNLISNNIISNNQYGIEYIGTYSEISKNKITNNTKVGIFLFSPGWLPCKYNIITRNNISNNKYGIEIYSYCKNNFVYHNKFINNFMNAKANESYYNKWDNGKSGNYWYNYTGKDKDGDGIGDTPYIICTNNIDNFPLMEPYGGFDPDAPDAPEINGPSRGKPGTKYDYTFSTIDPNNDDVYYYISWGDTTYEEWIGPYGSGEEVTINHTWKELSTYIITAQAKDINGLVGPEECKLVTIPRSSTTYKPLTIWLIERFPLLEVFLRAINLLR